MQCVGGTLRGVVVGAGGGGDDDGGGLSCWTLLCPGAHGHGCVGRRQPGHFADGAHGRCLRVRLDGIVCRNLVTVKEKNGK